MTPTYARVFGILALIAAILSLAIPVIGTLFVTPFAIIFGLVALWGGDKGMGISTIIIVFVNLIISPTFWANIYAGTTQSGAAVNRYLTYFDVAGILLLFFFLIVGGKKKV